MVEPETEWTPMVWVDRQPGAGAERPLCASLRCEGSDSGVAAIRLAWDGGGWEAQKPEEADAGHWVVRGGPELPDGSLVDVEVDVLSADGEVRTVRIEDVTVQLVE